MKSQSDDLEKKSRELEEREHSLNLRENLLEREKALEKRQRVFNEAEAKLDVLNKQIKAKQDVLASHEIEMDESIKKSKELVDKLHTQEENARKQTKIQEELLKKLKLQETSVQSSIQTKKTDLNDIRSQIKDSKDYLADQERLTTNTINEWNVTLQEFRNEADAIQKEKNKLSADIIRLDQKGVELTVEIDKQKSNLDALKNTYEQKVSIYKSDLKDLDVKLQNKKNELDRLITSADMRRIELETREKSLKLKEGNVNRRERELDQKERRLKGAYGMAEIPWDSV